MPSRPAKDGILSPVAVFAIHAVVFAALAGWSWRKWPDPLVDFGGELYTAWQLSEGRLLYVDIAAIFGPFSQYFNALWFRLMGVSFTTLIVLNLAILAAMLFGIYTWFQRACNRTTATVATLVALCLFAFSQYVVNGNYNFVTPYTHESTHSLALSVAVLLALDRAIRHRDSRFFACAGVLFGCVLLTKIETSVAIGTASATAMAAAAALGKEDRTSVLRGIAWFVGSAFLAVALFFLYLSSRMGTEPALRAMTGSVAGLLAGGIARTPFYAAGMGTDAPIANAIRMLVMFAGFLGFVAVAVLADLTWPRRLSSWQYVAWRVSRMIVLGLAFFYIPWFQFPRALPLITLGALCLYATRLWSWRHDREESLRNLSMLMWSVFALLMLTKIILNSRLYHYGFFLALPATLLLVAFVNFTVPALLARGGAGGQVFRTLAGLMLLAFVGNYLGTSFAMYARKDQLIGHGGDRFYTFNRHDRWEGEAVVQALDRIRRAPAKATLAVLPDGAMLNYQSRRRNPTPFINVTPPVLLAFGEDHILRTFKATPPDYIMIIHRDQSEYGVPPFGTHSSNGKKIVEWLKAHYRTIELIGTRNVEMGGGIEIMERQSTGS